MPIERGRFERSTGQREPVRWETVQRPLKCSQLTGSATYQGIAVGQYAYYQPFGGGLSAGGDFNARATLTATFSDDLNVAGTVRGTIDQFDDYPDWTLTLKQGADRQFRWGHDRPSH